MTFKILPGLATIADHYDAFILDLWGVVHNGHAPYAGAQDCMARLKDNGRQILLLSNAPRTSDHVIEFLKGMGVDRSEYDHILTSGDMTRQVLETGDHAFLADTGKNFYQIGPARDIGLDDGLGYTSVTAPEDADFLICTGLVDDEVETPESYKSILETSLLHKLPMFCANPDLTVMRGPMTVYCAGSVAALYEEMGGQVDLFGKPYAAAYHQSMAKLGITDSRKILAVGDSMRTDIKGANAANMDCVLVGGGIHAEDWGLEPGQTPTVDQIEAVSAEYGFKPTYVVAHMTW
ncbi:MAG: TIGR01459 family HAD-type hydrolase [Sneathiella sp.]|nr:MAG: TIGR01459 family HAD-type hydrolase [Sneathiella sp.]